MTLRKSVSWVLRATRLVFVGLVVVSAQPVLAQSMSACGPLQNHFGPYDYRTNTDKHNLVERYHFTPDVEQLRKGSTAPHVGGDISYTLKVFPNHPRALDAMARLSELQKQPIPSGSPYSVDCWFERAMRFRPDDLRVKLVYGLHLLRVGKNQEAVKYFEMAKGGERPDANLYYNLGLAYVKLGKFDAALESAHIAYGLGFPLPGLRNQLVRAGKWREPAAR